MIVAVGERRLVGARYGWMIQRRVVSEKTGEEDWREDRPANPASLSHGLHMLSERLLTDGPDVDITGLANAIREAQAALLSTVSAVNKIEL